MIEFVDKIPNVSDGTLIDREHLMGIQGFVTQTTTFNADGSITETNSYGHTKTTTFNNDGSITETFVGEKTITKDTSFVAGEIREEIRL